MKILIQFHILKIFKEDHQMTKFFPRKTGDWSLGVNFINILRAVFSYKSFAQSFFLLEVKVKFFTGAKKIDAIALIKCW